MSYEKHAWETGEVITADKLNNIESGIEEALECCEGGETSADEFIINVSSDPNEPGKTVSDKSFDEVNDAYNAGKALKVIDENKMLFTLVGIEKSLGGIEYRFSGGLLSLQYFLESATSVIVPMGCIVLSSNTNQPVKRYFKTVTLNFS